MYSAAFAAIVLFFQAAPAATPVPAKTAPAAETGHAVSGVTVTAKTPKSEEAAQNTVVCHSEPVLGSLFPKKVCATVRETADRKKNDQEVARDFQRSIIVGTQPQ